MSLLGDAVRQTARDLGAGSGRIWSNAHDLGDVLGDGQREVLRHIGNSLPKIDPKQLLRDAAARGAATSIGAMGLFKLARAHPFLTTGIAVGGASALTYSGQRVQSIPAGPTTVGRNPSSANSRDKYSLGATGDLVFSLNRLR